MEKLLLSRMEFCTAGLRAKILKESLLASTLDTTPKLCLAYCFDLCPRRLSCSSFFSNICPTPYVAFSCRSYGLCLGVICTASHNPKQDNGYKVYWNNGAIIPPHDRGIAEAIYENLEPWESSWEIPPIPEIYQNDLISDPMAEVDSEYMKLLKTSSTRLEKNKESKLKFTYTPVHGVGTKVILGSADTAKLNHLSS